MDGYGGGDAGQVKERFQGSQGEAMAREECWDGLGIQTETRMWQQC